LQTLPLPDASFLRFPALPFWCISKIILPLSKIILARGARGYLYLRARAISIVCGPFSRR
jgi:hypothetical protein